MNISAMKLLTALLLSCLLIAPAFSQTSRATVRLDGRPLLQVGAESRQEARARADQVERQLLRLLETRAVTQRVQILASGEKRELTVAGLPIIEVTPIDAIENGSSIDALAQHWQWVIDEAMQRAAARRGSAWARFGAQTRSSVETAFARLVESAIYVIPRLLAGITVLLLFWALAASVRWLMRLAFARVISDLTVENLIRQIAYYAIWAIGLVVATSALGFDPQALATGLGLTGVALGFALKDILSNFVAGVLILWMRPFEIGDQIVIGETEGAVERITLRATQIRTYDGRAVLVPNSEVFTSRVTNNTESPVRRGSVEAPLAYSADLRGAIHVLDEAARATPGVLPEPPPSVRVRELKQDDIILELRFWTDSRRSDFVSTTSAVRDAVVTSMKSAGIALPDPGARKVRLTT